MSLTRLLCLPYHECVVNISKVQQRHLFNVWIDVFCFKICHKDVHVGWSTYRTHGTAHCL